VTNFKFIFIYLIKASTSAIAVSLSFDVQLFNGKSTRQPNTNEFIDVICEQLEQAIETYEKTSLSEI
jgi:hypothetical protein